MIEKDLRDLTEEYIGNEDRTITVITHAFNPLKNKPVEATGTIKFKRVETRGELEVAYFVPIYLDYNVLDIDDDYQYELVSGKSMDHLWLLFCRNSMPEDNEAALHAEGQDTGLQNQPAGMDGSLRR